MMNQPFRYKKPDILQEIPHDNHVVIEASAGTGKTYTIEHLVVDLLLSDKGVRVDDILVVTFTVRATGELKHRVRKLLHDITTAYEAFHRNPAQGEDTAPDAPHWVIDANAYQALKRALFTFDIAPIHTIHGFCQRVLSDHAFQNQRLFNEQHLRFDEIFEKVFVHCLRTRFSSDEELIPYLKSWLEYEGASLDSLQQILKRCTSSRGRLTPQFDAERTINVLAQFKNVSSKAFLERLEEAMKAQKVHASTRKAMLKRTTEFFDLLQDYHSPDDLPLFLGQIPDDFCSYIAKSIHGKEMRGEVFEQLLMLTENLVPLKTAVVQMFLSALQDELSRAKDEQGFFSFDDMLSMVWDSLSREEHNELLLSLRRRYKYALIDEFQDTDLLQWQIFRKIFFESGRRNIMYLIGDPKQAIYSFRNADVYTYNEAVKDVLNGGGKRVRLEHNFRSSAEVVAAYNTVLDQGAEKPFFTGEINTYEHPVKCGDNSPVCSNHDGTHSAPVHVFELALPEQQATTRERDQAFAKLFAQEIRDLLNAPCKITQKDGSTKTLEPHDIYVVTRTIREGERIGEHLRALNVPYAFYKQDGLFQTAEAYDIYDLLCGIDAVHDRSKRFKAWATPFFGLSLNQLTECHELPDTHVLYTTLLKWRQTATTQKFDQLFTEILKESGLIRREIFTKYGERELTNYLHIFEILLEESQRARLNLKELRQRLKAFIDERMLPEGEDGNVQRLESERNAVQIMTMHKSKGLEADVVFIYGGFSQSPNRDGLCAFHDKENQPVVFIGSASSMTNKDDKKRYENELDEEDQRLYYVALTRARGRIYLPFCAPGTKLGSGHKVIAGAYRQLNNRLKHTLDSDAAQEFFHVRKTSLHTLALDDTPTEDITEKDVLWKLPEGFFDTTTSLKSLDNVFENLRQNKHLVTSYSRLKANQELAISSGNLDASALHDNVGDKADFSPRRSTLLKPHELRGGVVTGNFLHTLLENIDFIWARAIHRLENWLEDKEVDDIFSQFMIQFGIDEKYRKHAKEVIYNTLHANVPLPDLLQPKVVECTKSKRELEFLYPIPEALHPRIHELPEDRAFNIERGYVKGFIDFVFEHNGLVYFADWKSDILPQYDQETLTEYVENRYAIQASIYSIAMVKLLGIHDQDTHSTRFGGCFYFFLRGMDPEQTGLGVYFQRPEWHELVAYEQQLIAHDYA